MISGINLKNLAGEKYIVRDDGSQDYPWSYEIPCREGAIYAHGESSLAIWTASRHLAKKLTTFGLKPLQTGSEYSFKFPIAQLDDIAKTVGARKRRQISQEVKEKLTERLSHARV